MISAREKRRLKIKRRVSGSVKGTTERPRLSVFRSNKEIYGQLINDQNEHTVLALSSLKIEGMTGTKIEQSFQVGKAFAEMAKSNGIESVVFDRNGYTYHGRIKSFADGAREGGLKF